MSSVEFAELEKELALLSGKVDGSVHSLLYVLLDMVKSLQTDNLAQKKQIAELKRQLSQHSGNSHKPPSSDGFNKVTSVKSPGGKKRKVGGQPGHKGHKLEMVSLPHETQPHIPSSCSGCGHALDAAPVIKVERGQVFDLPPMELIVTEHQAETRQCLCCGVATRCDLPEGVSVGTQYGSGVRAFMTYLHSYQLIPVARCCELFEDLLGQSMSTGTCMNIQQDAYSLLAPFETHLKQNILESPSLGADETGMRVEGDRHWLHTISSAKHTLLYAHPSRGRKAIESYGVLPRYQGTLTHDR